MQTLYEYKPGNEPKIQVDAFERISNFIKEPTLDNFIKIITMYDVHQDGAAGYAEWGNHQGLSN